MTTAAPTTARRSPFSVGVTAAVLVTIVLTVMIGSGRIRIVDLLIPGTKTTPPQEMQVLRADFGPKVGRHEYRFDGVEFYIISRYFPDLRKAGAHLDNPRYRLQRIVQPALASVAGSGNAVILALAALNVLGVGLACGALADLAIRHGRDARVGYAAMLPLLLPLASTTTEAWTFGLAFLGLALLDRRRWWPAVALLTLAALSRETAVTVAVAAAVGLWLERRRPQAVACAAIPVAAVAGWFVFLAFYIGGPSTPQHVFQIIDVGPWTLLLTVATIGLAGWAAWAWRDVGLLWPIAAAYAIWPFLYDAQQLTWRGQIRVSAPGLALGLAALLSVAMPTSQLTPPARPPRVATRSSSAS